jgi:hypothetical protein
MSGARWSMGSGTGRWLGVLFGSAFLLVLLFGAALSAAPARAGDLGSGDELVLAALGGVRPLPIGEMAKESARGAAIGTEAGVHIQQMQPTVRLWDDFGAFSPSSIGNTVVTISTSDTSQ